MLTKFDQDAYDSQVQTDWVLIPRDVRETMYRLSLGLVTMSELPYTTFEIEQIDPPLAANAFNDGAEIGYDVEADELKATFRRIASGWAQKGYPIDVTDMQDANSTGLCKLSAQLN